MCAVYVAIEENYFEGKYFFEIISSLDRIREQLGPNRPGGIRGN
jgi:hypothetical protein